MDEMNLPPPPSKFRFLCIRCGEIFGSRDPEDMAGKLRCHSDCKPVERRLKMMIAHYDHGLDNMLWHTRKRLDQVNREVTDQHNVAATLLRQVEDLRGQLKAKQRQADDLRGQLKAARFECKQLQSLAAMPKSGIGEALAAVAGSSATRARKLRASLHPDGLSEELRVGAKRAWDEAKL